MLQTVGDVITEVLVRNNRTTTDSFVTDAMLQDWFRMANNYCVTQYKWPFSEVRDQSTSWSGTEEVDYSSFTVDFKANSIRYLKIGTEKLQKIDFQEYQKFRQELPSDNMKVFAEFSRVLYINPYSGLSGTIYAFGQATVKVDPTDLTATTIFSPYDEEGNEAIVEKMSSYLKRREHLPDEAELHDNRTDVVLKKVWDKVLEEKYEYQSGRNSQGMFQRLDVVYGDFDDSLFKRDQF